MGSTCFRSFCFFRWEKGGRDEGEREREGRKNCNKTGLSCWEALLRLRKEFGLHFLGISLLSFVSYGFYDAFERWCTLLKKGGCLGSNCLFEFWKEVAGNRQLVSVGI